MDIKFKNLEGFINSEKFKTVKSKIKTGSIKNCLYCNAEFYTIKSYSNKKYCNAKCYQSHKAEIFDKHIIDNFNYSEFNNYDNFLTKEFLKCPVKNCDWSGHHLGLHLAKMHNMSAEKFRKIAGFNKNQGLVSYEMREKLENRQVSEKALCELKKGRENIKQVNQEKRKQEIQSKIKFNSLNKKTYDYEMKCSFCGKIFLGDMNQYYRNKKGLNVCCSVICKQTLASHSRGLANGN